MKVLRVLFAIATLCFGLVHLGSSMFLHLLEYGSAGSHNDTPNHFNSNFLLLLGIILIVAAGFALAARRAAFLIIAAVAIFDASLFLWFWFWRGHMMMSLRVELLILGVSAAVAALSLLLAPRRRPV